MKPKLFVPLLTDGQRRRLRNGLLSRDAFTVRRCQILLQSADGLPPSRIAQNLGCTPPTVHHTIHAFTRERLDCLKQKSSRPHSARPFLDHRFVEPLKDVLHHSPRLFGKPTSLWTLDLVAELCHTKGWTPRQLTAEAIRLALKRLKIRWKRAKHWISSPDPAYARKKSPRSTDPAGRKPSRLGAGLPG
jgi:transposase